MKQIPRVISTTQINQFLTIIQTAVQVPAPITLHVLVCDRRVPVLFYF